MSSSEIALPAPAAAAADVDPAAADAAPAATAGAPAPPPCGPGWAAQARAFVALAVPMVVSRLGLAAMGIVDGLMLARHDSRQLAFHGLAEALAGRVMEVGMALVMAGMALAAQARHGDAAARARVGGVWRQALMLSVLAGIAGLAVGALAQPLLQALGQPPELAGRSAPVLTILLLGMPAALVAIACAGLLEAIGRPTLVALAVVAANLANAGLNTLLIDGIAGGPPLGAQGVAWSTTLVRSLLACVLVLLARRLAEAPAHDLLRWPARRDWSGGAEQRARGRSAAGSVAVLGVLGAALPTMAGWLGAGAMGAFTALFLVLAPVMVVAWGLVDAAGLRLAAEWGRDHGSGRLRRTGGQLTAMAVAVLALLAAALLALPDAALRPVVPDPALRSALRAALPAGLVLVTAEGLSYLLANLLRSLGVLRRPFWLQAGFAALALPAAWLLGIHLGGGLAGLLAGQAAVTVLRALLLGRLYARVSAGLDRARRQRRRSRIVRRMARQDLRDRRGREPKAAAAAAPAAPPSAGFPKTSPLRGLRPAPDPSPST